MTSHHSGISSTVLIALIICVLIIFFLCVVCFIWKFRKVNKADALSLDSIVPEKRRNLATTSSIVLAEVERAKDFRERAKVITISRPNFKKSHKRQGNNSLYTRALAYRTLNDNEFRLHFNDLHRNSLTDSTTDNDSARFTSHSDNFLETPRMQSHNNNTSNPNMNNNNSNNNSSNSITINDSNNNNNNVFDISERYEKTMVEDILGSFLEEP